MIKYGLTRFSGFCSRNRHLILNIYLGLNIAVWTGWQLYQSHKSNTIGFVEVSFAVQNVIMLLLILLRLPHKKFDKNIFSQSIAVIAFMSGLVFMGQRQTADPTLILWSGSIIFLANVLGTVSLINLGRSFGILIAHRSIKTRGLYTFVRHPMYATDILLRCGYMVSHFNLFTALMFLVSTACYVYRAILEEKFLLSFPEYRLYLQKVKYRFIPLLF